MAVAAAAAACAPMELAQGRSIHAAVTGRGHPGAVAGRDHPDVAEGRDHPGVAVARDHPGAATGQGHPGAETDRASPAHVQDPSQHVASGGPDHRTGRPTANDQAELESRSVRNGNRYKASSCV